MATEPKCFEINLTDRYVLVITVPDDVEEEEIDRVAHRVAQHLNEWWRSDRKFVVLAATADTNIEVRRLGEDDGG